MKCSENPIKDPVKPLLLKPLSLKLSCTHELLGGPPGTHPWPGRKVNHHHLFSRIFWPHAAPAEIKLTDVVRKGVNHAAPHDLHHLGQTINTFEIIIGIFTCSASSCVASSLNSILARASVNLKKMCGHWPAGGFRWLLGAAPPYERFQLSGGDGCRLRLRPWPKLQVEVLDHLDGN